MLITALTKVNGEEKVKAALDALKHDVMQAYIAENTSEVLNAAVDDYLQNNEDDVVQHAVETFIKHNRQVIEHKAIEKLMDEMRENIDQEILREQREKHLAPYLQRVYTSDEEMQKLAKRRAQANQEKGIDDLFDKLMSAEARVQNTDMQMQDMAHDFYHEDATVRERKMHQEITQLKRQVINLQHRFTEDEELHIEERTTKINADGSKEIHESGVHSKSNKESVSSMCVDTSTVQETKTDLEEVVTVPNKCAMCNAPMKVKRAMWYRRNKLCDKCQMPA